MEQKVVKMMHSPTNPRVEVACGVALTAVPPYSPQRLTLQVVRHRTDTLESRQAMRTRQLPDTVTVTLDPAFQPQGTVIFDDWKVTVRLLGLSEVESEPGAREYELHVTGAAISRG